MLWVYAGRDGKITERDTISCVQMFSDQNKMYFK